VNRGTALALAGTAPVGARAWQANPSTGLAEKVLLTTARFAKDRANEHRMLIAALAEACAWCDEPHNREPLAELLAETCYRERAQPRHCLEDYSGNPNRATSTRANRFTLPVMKPTFLPLPSASIAEPSSLIQA